MEIAALPTGLSTDGKHVWEPPIFSYSALIGESGKKRREEVPEVKGGDRTMTTEFMDFEEEKAMLGIYYAWHSHNIYDARKAGDDERASFFTGVHEKVYIDGQDLAKERPRFDFRLDRMRDETWKARSWLDWNKDKWGDMTEHYWYPWNTLRLSDLIASWPREERELKDEKGKEK